MRYSFQTVMNGLMLVVLSVVHKVKRVKMVQMVPTVRMVVVGTTLILITSDDQYKIQFLSNDGLGFTTANLKGPPGEPGQDGQDGQDGKDFDGQIPHQLLRQLVLYRLAMVLM